MNDHIYKTYVCVETEFSHWFKLHLKSTGMYANVPRDMDQCRNEER
jgi:hypothetical protein